MKRISIIHRSLPALLAVLLCLLAGCAGKEDQTVSSLEQLNQPGRKIGVASDTAEDRLVAQELPQAQIEYFSDDMAAYTSVQKGKIDAFVFNRLTLESAIYNGLEGVHLLEETLGEGNVGAVAISPVTQIPDLEEKINAFLREIKSDGTLEDMAQRWLVRHEETMPEIPMPERADVRLTVGTTGLNMPFTYYAGTELAGYDIELARRFAAWLGASLEFKVYDYEGIVAAAQGGDVDCIFANLFVTPERQEAVRFSEPTYVGEVGVMVRDGNAAEDSPTGEVPAAVGNAYRSLEDFSGKRIGVVTGAVQGPAIEKEIPTAEVSYFNSVPDLLAALRLGKIDAFSATDQIIRYLMIENEDLTYLDQPLTEPMDTGAIFPKTEAGAALKAEFNEYLAQARAEGVLEELEEIWLGKDESRKTVLDLAGLSGENGTLVLDTDSSMIPSSYVKDNVYVGLDIDNVLRFCQARGYALEIMDMSFSGLVDAVVTGKCDFAAGAIAYTEERAQSVDFSDPVYQGYSVVAYLKTAGSSETGAAKTLEEISGGTIGVLTGTNIGEIVGARLPEAQLLYFNTMADQVNALESGKVDAVATDEPVARTVMAENGNLTVLSELLDSLDYAFVLSKTDRGRQYCDELSAFLRRLREDGTLEELQSKWFDNGNLSEVAGLDYRALPGPNGTLRAAVFQYLPFIVLNGDLLTGYELDLLTLFCQEQGYALEVTEMNSDAILSTVQSEKCDVGACCITVTEERKESVLFTEPDYSGGTALLVLKEGQAAPAGSFLDSVAESFEKTFLRENRWQLFLEGIGTTLLITVLSILFGTLLGFGVFMLCRNGNPVANGVTRFFVWLVRGMPVVVLLMILYYIIFGNVSISGTAVSIVGFTLVFGAGVYGIIKAGVGAIDSGQLETAYALGYSNRRAFFRVILPQALPHFMPAYKSSITEIIKATAIVGYVAVQDLTKMGDIIRSRTYDAFFPLIAVAVIYFILAAILTFLVKRVELRLDPRQRKPEKVRKEVEGR